MKMNFLLYKDKEERRKSSPQKQEYGCPSLKSSLRSHTHAFFTAQGQPDYIMVKATTIKGAKTIN